MKTITLVAGAAVVAFALYHRHKAAMGAPVSASSIYPTSGNGLAVGDAPAPTDGASVPVPSLATPPLIGQDTPMGILPVSRSSPDAVSMGFDPLNY